MGILDLDQVVDQEEQEEDNLDVCLSVMDIAVELAYHSTSVVLNFH